MPTPAEPGKASRLNPLGLWFCALAALGYLRFFATLARRPELDVIAWLWLGGSVVLSLLGMALVLQVWRKGH